MNSLAIIRGDTSLEELDNLLAVLAPTELKQLATIVLIDTRGRLSVLRKLKEEVSLIKLINAYNFLNLAQELSVPKPAEAFERLLKDGILSTKITDRIYNRNDAYNLQQNMRTYFKKE